MLARWTHAMPYAIGSPTVVSQEVKAVFGTSGVGHLLFYVVQLATMLILYTGGNTSFNGFPFLANFVAGDRFLPRQLTQRGHRLAFSNGIIVLPASPWRSSSSSRPRSTGSSRSTPSACSPASPWRARAW